MPDHPHAVEINVAGFDVLRYPANVLALKYAQGFYGVDLAVSRALEAAGTGLEPEQMPEPGKLLLVDPKGAVWADAVLFVGVNRLRHFEYREIREFSKRVLVALVTEAPATRTLAITLHGPGYGLDEAEAFRSELAGLIDGLTAGAFPPSLRRITFVEIDEDCAHRLQEILEEMIPAGVIETEAGRYRETLTEPAVRELDTVGYASNKKPHVFVAMPFDKKMKAVYRFGIEQPVKDAGYLCERADETAFMGDILQRVKERIASADLVVADLTGANPNVYLEVGYAWGRGKPTVLVVASEQDLKFDVRGQRCLVYEDDITQLEELMRKELAGLPRLDTRTA